MPAYGLFQTIAELATSGPFTLYSGHRSGESLDTPTVAIKTFRTLDDLADPEILAARAASFLRCAQAQSKLAAGAPTLFVKIHESGQAADAAYYVADFMPLSAQWLVDKRKDLSARELAGIIGGVAEGIAALRTSGVTRAHGNIKPANVLLTSQEVGEASAILTDPLDPDQLTDDSVQDDLKALGTLMFELVAHRAAPSGTQIRRGPEWDRLGGPGELLRHLCEQLINPTAEQELPVEGVKERLAAALKVKDKIRVPMAAIVAAVVVVLGGGGGGGYWYYKHDQEQKALAAEANKPKEEEVLDLRTEPYKQKLRETLTKADELLNAGATAARFTDLGAAGAGAKEAIANNYHAVSDELEKYLKMPDDKPDERKAANAVGPGVEKKINALAGKINSTLDVLEGKKAMAALSEGIKKRSQTIENLGVTAGKLEDAAKPAAQQALDGIKKSLEGVSAAEKELSTKIAAAEAALGATAESTEPATESNFRDKVQAAVALLTGVDDAAKSWRGTYDVAGTELTKLIAADSAKFEEDRKAHHDAVDVLVDSAKSRFFDWAREDYDYDEGTNKSKNDYQKRLARIDEWVAALKRTESIGIVAKPSSVVKVDEVKALAAAERKGQLTGMIGTKREERKTMGMISSLELSDQKTGLPDLTAGLTAWMGAATDLIDQTTAMQGSMDDGYGWGEAGPGGKTLKALRDSVAGHAQLADIAGKGKSAGSAGDAGAYSVVADAINKVIARADSVASVANMTAPDALIAIAKDPAGANLSRTLAAWDKLAMLPTFPKSASEFDDLKAIKEGLAKQIVKASGEARQKAISSAVEEAYRKAYIAMVNQRLGSSPAEVIPTFAAEKLKSWNLTQEQIEKDLTPAARINLKRVRLIETLSAAAPAGAGKDKSEMDKQARDLAAAVNGGFFGAVESDNALNAAAQASKEYLALDSKLKGARAGKAQADLTAVGPGQLGWACEPADDGSKVKYTVKIGATSRKDPPAALEFIKLPMSTDDTTYYLLSTEVSVGMLVDILEAGGDKPAAGKVSAFTSQLVRPYFNPANDDRVGPRCWTYSNDEIHSITWPKAAKGNKDNPSQGWLSTFAGMANIPNFYPSGVTVSPPERQSPMNMIGFDAAAYIAAMANCRLPTGAEWASAASGGEPRDANRRDQTWRAQYDAIDAAAVVPAVQPGVKPKLLPDAGMFLPAAMKAGSAQPNAAAVDGSDGVLWFAPVDKGAETPVSGGVFHHLFGNVAEWVCEDTAIFAGNRKPMDIAKAAAEPAEIGKFGVIGASALSPKEVAPGTALAVDKVWHDGYSDVGFRLAFQAAGGSGGAGGPYAAAIKNLKEMAFLPGKP